MRRLTVGLAALVLPLALASPAAARSAPPQPTMRAVQSVTSTRVAALAGDSCIRVTATGGMKSNIGQWLFTFTSANVSCVNAARTKVTYFAWETPTYHITSWGQLAGWQWNGWTHDRTRLSPCLVIGNSIGNFKQTYPGGIGQIGSANVKQHLERWCKGYRWVG